MKSIHRVEGLRNEHITCRVYTAISKVGTDADTKTYFEVRSQLQAQEENNAMWQTRVMIRQQKW